MTPEMYKEYFQQMEREGFHEQRSFRVPFISEEDVRKAQEVSRKLQAEAEKWQAYHRKGFVADRERLASQQELPLGYTMSVDDYWSMIGGAVAAESEKRAAERDVQ